MKFFFVDFLILLILGMIVGVVDLFCFVLLCFGTPSSSSNEYYSDRWGLLRRQLTSKNERPSDRASPSKLRLNDPSRIHGPWLILPPSKDCEPSERMTLSVTKFIRRRRFGYLRAQSEIRLTDLTLTHRRRGTLRSREDESLRTLWVNLWTGSERLMSCKNF